MSQKLLEGLTLQASRIDDDGRYNYEAFIRVDGQTGGARVIERAEDQSLAPTKELRKAEIERALRLLRHIP